MHVSFGVLVPDEFISRDKPAKIRKTTKVHVAGSVDSLNSDKCSIASITNHDVVSLVSVCLLLVDLRGCFGLSHVVYTMVYIRDHPCKPAS